MIIEKLDTSKHDRELFDCGLEVLNVFLKQRAYQEQKKRLNITYVAIENKESPKPILGYYTLSNSALALSVLEPNFKKHIFPSHSIPSVKIGRLAIDKRSQKKGMGKLLLQHAFFKILEASLISGIRGIEVIAKNAETQNFYKKFGFINLNDAENLLFMPLDTLIRAQDS